MYDVISPTQPGLLGGTDEAYLRFTADHARQKVRIISELRDKEIELNKEIERNVENLKALNAVLQSYGQNPIGAEVIGSSEAVPGSAGFATPGNKSPGMPPRQPEFRDIALGDAAEAVLSSQFGQVVHVDEIAKRIFKIEDRRGLSQTKRSLNSALSQGVKQRRWKRVSGGHYKIDETTGESREAISPVDAH